MRNLCLATTALLCFAVHADEPALRFSVSDSSTMPMMSIEDGVARAGILNDLHLRIAEKLGRRAQQTVMPRLRIQKMMADGRIDVSCYLHPAWLYEDGYRYRWTVPFMVQRNQLVAGDTAVTAPEHGEVIGTVLGFSYPPFDAEFASGALRRDDGRTQEIVLAKLEAGRYRFAISNELSLRWFNRYLPPQDRLVALRELSAEPVACIVRDVPDVPAAEIVEAMQQMQRDGEFEAILERYR
ncbi:substrate-binding periplasmic protein [Stutzerimonas azotifigens]|uniref:ABC transporter substrate-binding protein n=1 Tax=Stutzerimonas azotifigens TaxID=291995 RepID=A0ABR5YWB1_9GAMM|nr:ABC transporter substrate-binding protein [Stutzerimonas azotifigens]MBA1272206.1 ABC transporter substrate-binding protein [Stutzerimonas azotifigens]